MRNEAEMPRLREQSAALGIRRPCSVVRGRGVLTALLTSLLHSLPKSLIGKIRSRGEQIFQSGCMYICSQVFNVTMNSKERGIHYPYGSLPRP